MGKKLYILTESIGTGHSQAARAVAEMIQLTHPEDSVEVIDFLSSSALSIDQILKRTYLTILEKAPSLYDKAYTDSDQTLLGDISQSVLNKMLTRRLEKLVSVLHPDALMFTHPFPAGAADRLRRMGKLSIPLMGIVTDFDAHQLWADPHLDSLCVATEGIKEKFTAYGLDADKIHVTGIPVRRAFYECSGKAGYEKGAVLVMGGGLGLGDILDNLKRLDQDEEIKKFIVITGKNISLYEKAAALSKNLKHPLELHSYTNKVAQIMQRSDVLVTKPGALTCTEAMVMNLPMVLVNTLPGQERVNAAYMVAKGCAKWVKRGELADTVSHIISDRALRDQMADACGKDHPESSKNVVHELYRLFHA